MKYGYNDICYMIKDFQMCIEDIRGFPTLDKIQKDTLIEAYKNAIFLGKYVVSQMAVEIPDDLTDKE